MGQKNTKHASTDQNKTNSDTILLFIQNRLEMLNNQNSTYHKDQYEKLKETVQLTPDLLQQLETSSVDQLVVWRNELINSAKEKPTFDDKPVLVSSSEQIEVEPSVCYGPPEFFDSELEKVEIDPPDDVIPDDTTQEIIHDLRD